MPDEFNVYKHAAACAEAAIGWIYGIAGIGLILNMPRSYRLAWIQGAVLIYHGIGIWFEAGNQKKIGHRFLADSFRTFRSSINIISGILAFAIAWYRGRELFRIQESEA